VELIEQRVSAVLVGRDASDRFPLLAAVGNVLKFAPFTLAAVDTALLDLVGRSRNLPVHALLGGAFRDRIEVHGSVGWNEDPAKMAEAALEQAGTYRWLKLYAGRGELGADLDRLQAVREAVGPDMGLFVDINTMWSPSDLVRALPRVEEIGLSMLEQPLPPAAAGLLPQLVGARPVDIAADEAVRTVEDASAVIASRSATVINVGHSKLGGPTAALQSAQIAAASGVGVMVGSVIEMGIATAMGLHLAAALPRLAYPSYLMGPLKYAQQITAQHIDVVDGHVAVPSGAGLGVTVDEAELRSIDARTQI
jgi:muconate cycloisomerase